MEQRDTKIIFVIGLAGSGKTTFVEYCSGAMSSVSVFTEIVNWDPTVEDLPYVPHLDIRDDFKTSDIMEKHQLGPNGAAMTAINLYAANFDKYIDGFKDLIGKVDFIFVDTPGQIETFTWSAGGQILIDILGSLCPCLTVFMFDTGRSNDPLVYVSTMLYASSIMMKSEVPFAVIYSKIAEDFAVTEKVKSWRDDVLTLCDAISESDQYYSAMSLSLALSLADFFEKVPCHYVDSADDHGFNARAKYAPEADSTLEYEDSEDLLKFLSSNCKVLPSPDNVKLEIKTAD